MPVLPAICDNCDNIFPSGIRIANSTGFFSGNRSGPCPACGGMGHIPDGEFRVVENTIEILSAPQRTVDELRRLNDILLEARSKNFSPEQVAEEIRLETPTLSSLLNFLKNDDFKFWLTTLIAVLSLMVALSNSKDVENSPPQPPFEVEQVINHIYYGDKSSSVNSLLNQNNIENSNIKQQPIRIEKYRRNSPCYCGSGTKYKKCHGIN